MINSQVARDSSPVVDWQQILWGGSWRTQTDNTVWARPGTMSLSAVQSDSFWDQAARSVIREGRTVWLFVCASREQLDGLVLQ
jgi:hypothetical protein